MEQMRPRIGDDDLLPLDELDPCCAKELKHESEKARIGGELRKTDRSMLRYDLKQAAFDNLRNGNRCKCCKVSEDYYLLLKLRKEEESRRRSDVKGVHEESEEEDDDDYDVDFGPVCYTDYEVAAMEEMKSRALAYERAKLAGYGVHIEQSAAHIQQKLIPRMKYIVLHVYNSDSVLQARMNLHLEGMSAKFIGTAFRRIEAGPAAADLLTKLQGSPVHLNSAAFDAASNSKCGGLGCLVAISDCSILACTNHLNAFGDDEELVSTELDKWLDHTGVLSTDVPEALLGHFKADRENGDGRGDLSSSDDEGENEEGGELRSYCDLSGCGRDYPHEHVGSSNGSSGLKGLGSLSVETAKSGESVFSKDLLQGFNNKFRN